MHRPDVDGMLREMPFRRFLEWRAFDKIEPIGGRRGDFQAASICSTIMNATAMRVGSKQRFKVKDYVLEYGEEKDATKEGATPTAQPPRKTVDEMKFIARMMTAAANADAGANKKKRRR